jgi:hypothetical protein
MMHRSNKFRIAHLWSLVLPWFFAVPAAAQLPPVGIVDFYGLRTLVPADLAGALALQIGDSLPANPETLRERLRLVPGVQDAAVSAVCCEAGRAILYVGIREAGAAVLEFAAAPTGGARLPDEIMTAGNELMRALLEGVRRGQTAEEDSAGHTVYLYPPARPAQQKLIDYAAYHEHDLREVLLSSDDPNHRGLAAQVIAYVPNKQSVVADLVSAARDADADVRNNAVRALAVMSMYAQSHPEAGLNVPYGPLIDLLSSLEWTDRNKASLALAALTADRDPVLLQQLREQALPSLVEMARWRAFGHAAAAGIILGRLANVPEDKIFPMLQKNREGLISAALEP